MYALCVSGAVNTQGFVWKFFVDVLVFSVLYINFHSFKCLNVECFTKCTCGLVCV